MIFNAVYLTPADLHERWGRAEHTLANDRDLGFGPPYYRFGRQIRYRLDDVIAYEEANRVETTGSRREREEASR